MVPVAIVFTAILTTTIAVLLLTFLLLPLPKPVVLAIILGILGILGILCAFARCIINALHVRVP